MLVSSRCQGRAIMRRVEYGKIFLLIGSLIVSTASPAAAFTLEGSPKIAWIYHNAKNDGGWQQAIDEARVKIEKELDTTIAYVDNVPDNASMIKPAVELF